MRIVSEGKIKPLLLFMSNQCVWNKLSVKTVLICKRYCYIINNYIELFHSFSSAHKLLADGAPTDILLKGQVSPLHVLIGVENIVFSEDLTELLLDYGADPNIRFVFEKKNNNMA